MVREWTRMAQTKAIIRCFGAWPVCAVGKPQSLRHEAPHHTQMCLNIYYRVLFVSRRCFFAMVKYMYLGWGVKAGSLFL